MKRILVIIFSLLSITSTLLADEKMDSLQYYFQHIPVAYKVGDYQDACLSYKNLLRLYGECFGDISQDTIYAQIEGNYAYLCHKIGDYKTAISLETEASNIYKKYGTDNLQYATSLSILASYYYDFGNYIEAITLGTEAIEIRKEVLGINNIEYAKSLNNLAECYSALGDYNEAIRLATEALNITKTIFGLNHPDYAMSLSNIASYYYYLGDFNGAIRLGIEAMEIRKNVLGTNHPDYALSLSNLSTCFSALGNYAVSIQLKKEALNIFKSTIGLDHPYYYTLLHNLSIDYAENRNFNEAIQLENEVLEYRRSTYGTKHPDYAASLNSLAAIYSELGNYSEAIKLETEALNIEKSTLGSNHPSYAQSLSNLSTYYAAIDNDNEAIRLETEALNIRKSVFGEEHHLYACSLENLALYSLFIGNNNEARQLLNDYASIVRKIVLNTFTGLTAEERQMYWNQYSFALNQRLPAYIVHSPIPDAASWLYDNTALFAKGLLLSTELEMVKLIQENGDDKALEMYSKLRSNRLILNAQYLKPISERQINCDSLEKVSTELERQLVSHVKEFGDYTRNLNITWRDVQSKLNGNDIAIEFLSYREKDGEMRYAALTLCKNDTAPILMPLFVESELLEASREDNTYQNGKADSLIWEPLIAMLEGKSHVYFSASGMLHNIGIEYLPSMEGKECYRLSSTRELATHQPGQTIGSATLYGDIDYDATYASIGTSELSSVSDYAMNTTSNLYRGRFNYPSMRYGVSPLPGTREEIKEVSALLKPLGKPCEALTGTRASEESFKALSGQRKSLLHISTHGFYYTDEEANNLNDHLQMMLIGDNGPTNCEDLSLLRCGLCFAGANQTLSGESQPAAGQGDGILNALEIAQTDLRGLDLVVLSACQTALGDIAQGEGVFGLQRGFKKAGAKSILMSLWNVDDEVTQLLMTEFYRGWTSGMSKTAALKNAQSIVKEKYPDPRYWAAFILLDALD